MRGAIFVSPGIEFGGDAFGQGHEGAGLRAVGIARGDRRAAVRGFADGDVERDLAQEIATEFRRRLARAAVAEDVRLVPAVRDRYRCSCFRRCRKRGHAFS